MNLVPGQVFMLDENALVESVQSLHASSKWQDKFSFTESAGVRFDSLQYQ